MSSLFGASGGGAGLVVEWLAGSLAERGFPTCVITIPEGPLPEGDRVEPYEIVGLRPLNLYSIHDKDRYPMLLRAGWQTIDTWNLTAFHQLLRSFTSFRPDVVHVHKLRGFSPAVWHAAKAAGVRAVVQTCQDYEIMSPEGTLSGRVGRMAVARDWKLRPYQSLRSRWSRTVSAVTSPSNHTLNTILGAGFFRNVPAQVIPNSNGFSDHALARLRKEPHPDSNASLRLLYLGRLVETKGVDVLCQAVAASDDDIVLDVAGWGEDEGAMRRRWSGCERIRFCGAVSGPTKHSILAQCNALAVPSIWPEVFGIVITEALAFGKPTIASRVGGVPEVVAEGRTGLLIPPNDVEALGALLSRVARDRSILLDMRHACFERARQYSTDTIAEEYLELYARHLAAPGQP